ncbi:MAG: MFS transporter [Gemmataceae bacterium]|nr:MFS transporter [Gemmataceae bacterium]
MAKNETADTTRLKDITPNQWKSGAAAWLGWTFDGLDMHLYTLVAASYVAALLHTSSQDPAAREHMGYIQAAFLVGWALGGAFFGRLGDLLGRSRSLILTILTYAIFTGFSAFATTWWHLLIFRFLAALGIGGEWAIGASMLSETWPAKWRPWLAAILQSGVNFGVLVATMAGLARTILPETTTMLGFEITNFNDRALFLVGLIPALLTFWIRKHVPEPEEWHEARAKQVPPKIRDLFQGKVKRITLLTVLVCGFSLTGHWAFQFWAPQQFGRLPEYQKLKAENKEEGELQTKRAIAWAFLVMNATAVAGNFLAAFLATRFGYRRSIAFLCLMYALSLALTYCVPRPAWVIMLCLPLMGLSQGVFGLFTMYLPPLFPTLLRTTGAGFCYNIGRIAAAGGTIAFGMASGIDYNLSLALSGLLFLPAMFFALRLPEHHEINHDGPSDTEPVT